MTQDAGMQARSFPEQHKAFLEKVMADGNLPDLYDARDITEVVFRVMRDLMTAESIDRVKSELDQVQPAETDDKALQTEISDLWKDTNPIVGFLSRVRPPFNTSGALGIDSERFLTRVANESGLPPHHSAEQVVKAVFSATKAELSSERIQEVSQSLPPGSVQTLWQQA